MLTMSEQTLKDLVEQRNKKVFSHRYGQEINADTYTICKANLLLKGEGNPADNIVGGPGHSTLSCDAVFSQPNWPCTFDFMLSNPPYVRIWRNDVAKWGGERLALRHQPRLRPRVFTRDARQRRVDDVPGKCAEQDEEGTIAWHLYCRAA